MSSITLLITSLIVPLHDQQGNQRWQIPRHMPVLGNVHPIKLENVDIFFVT